MCSLQPENQGDLENLDTCTMQTTNSRSFPINGWHKMQFLAHSQTKTALLIDTKLLGTEVRVCLGSVAIEATRGLHNLIGPDDK
jgi:hypothetical protein